MKKFLFSAVLVMIATLGFAQKPAITFEKTTHDFGFVKQENGDVKTVFTFTNTGDAPLIVTNLNASCGCTTPNRSIVNKPIAPGESGEIEVGYGAATRPGGFNKTVSVYTNADDKALVLTIKGEVQRTAVATQ